MNRIIFHIDFDSFFASVQQQENPEFRGKPLGITATNGRNCIIASSREAKKLGIGTGSRVHDALRICPEILLSPADFTKYWHISKKFIGICKDFSPSVEIFSIDELFMDVTLTAHLFGGVEMMVKKIKDRIREEVGEYITVSVGVSHNKLLAKLASGMKKPDGVFFITPASLPSVYNVAHLTDICGIGSRIEARLRMMGITTLLKLREAPLEALTAEFGHVEGQFLKNVGLGIDEREVLSYTDDVSAKSVSRNYCLAQNEYDKRIVLQNIYELCEEIGLKLRRLQMRAKTAGVFLRGDAMIGGTLSQEVYVNSGDDLFKRCLRIINTACHPESSRTLPGGLTEMLRHVQYDPEFKGYIRQISVWSGNLKHEDELTLPLLEEERKKETLVSITDEINEKFGDHTIRNGFLLYAKKLTTVPNGYMADRYERAMLPGDESVRIQQDSLVRSAYRE